MPVEHGAVAVERVPPGPPVSPKAPWQSEMAASNSASKVEGPGVGPPKVAPGGASAVARSTNRWLMSTPTHLHAPPGQGVGVAAGAAADVEHPHPRLEPEHVDEERDLLLGALRERVAQVGRPEVVGDRLEPVARRLGHPNPGVPTHSHSGGNTCHSWPRSPHSSAVERATVTE